MPLNARSQPEHADETPKELQAVQNLLAQYFDPEQQLAGRFSTFLDFLEDPTQGVLPLLTQLEDLNDPKYRFQQTKKQSKLDQLSSKTGVVLHQSDLPSFSDQLLEIASSDNPQSYLQLKGVADFEGEIAPQPNQPAAPKIPPTPQIPLGRASTREQIHTLTRRPLSPATDPLIRCYRHGRPHPGQKLEFHLQGGPTTKLNFQTLDAALKDCETPSAKSALSDLIDHLAPANLTPENREQIYQKLLSYSQKIHFLTKIKENLNFLSRRLIGPEAFDNLIHFLEKIQQALAYKAGTYKGKQLSQYSQSDLETEIVKLETENNPRNTKTLKTLKSLAVDFKTIRETGRLRDPNLTGLILSRLSTERQLYLNDVGWNTLNKESANLLLWNLQVHILTQSHPNQLQKLNPTSLLQTWPSEIHTRLARDLQAQGFISSPDHLQWYSTSGTALDLLYQTDGFFLITHGPHRGTILNYDITARSSKSTRSRYGQVTYTFNQAPLVDHVAKHGGRTYEDLTHLYQSELEREYQNHYQAAAFHQITNPSRFNKKLL